MKTKKKPAVAATHVVTEDGTKVRKIEPYSRYWEHLADIAARELTEMVPCKYCGGPRPAAYKCPRCGYE